MRFLGMSGRATIAFSVVFGLLTGAVGSAQEPVRLRVEPLTVPPATQPLIGVVVENLRDQPWRGELSLAGPDGWRIAPESRTIEVPASGERRFAFNIEKARNVEANSYPLRVTARVGDQVVERSQAVFVASAPYSKAVVDGRADEWQDAIPVTFQDQGKRTTVRTFWSRKRFYLLVTVQEDQHVGEPGPGRRLVDAVQLAVSPLDDADGPARTSQRAEWLLRAGDGGADCYQLAAVDTPIASAGPARDLELLRCRDVEVAIQRKGDVTHYECAIPFRLLRDAVEPAEGREFFLSVLVHDPDGTGLRDLGRAAGLWARAADAAAWSRWPGAAWEKTPPLGNKVRWGLCTSKY